MLFLVIIKYWNWANLYLVELYALCEEIQAFSDTCLHLTKLFCSLFWHCTPQTQEILYIFLNMKLFWNPKKQEHFFWSISGILCIMPSETITWSSFISTKIKIEKQQQKSKVHSAFPKYSWKEKWMVTHLTGIKSISQILLLVENLWEIYMAWGSHADKL